MRSELFWVIVGVAVVAISIAVVYLTFVFTKARRVGTKGIVQRSHLRCPKCEREFDYDWIPGASLTSVRLGPDRYMACPLCGKWSMFNIYAGLVARPSPETATAPPAGPSS